MKKAFQDLIAPEIHALRGDVRVVNEKITALDQTIDCVDTRSSVRIDYLDDKLTSKIDSLRNEMISEIRRVDIRIDGMDRDLQVAIDIRERLAVLEARRPA